MDNIHGKLTEDGPTYNFAPNLMATADQRDFVCVRDWDNVGVACPLDRECTERSWWQDLLLDRMPNWDIINTSPTGAWSSQHGPPLNLSVSSRSGGAHG